MPPIGQRAYPKRQLGKWQIFFIALGGIIGVGFFRGSSKSLATCGPIGALIAVLVVGVVAISVMECISELVILWPIPNAMVEYVKAFVDEDLGTAIGVMYWYTYCVTFSALIIAAADLTQFWGTSYLVRAMIYVLAPVVLVIINALPVHVFGWVELFGGMLKLALVVFVVVLMFMVNVGVGTSESIGTQYIKDSVQNNINVATSHWQAVFEAIPLATFAYIGIELLTTTAFEAFDNGASLKLPARNIGWFSAMLYTFATGTFVANVSWQDQNLPQLFQQLLTPTDELEFQKFADGPNTSAAPLIALIRAEYSIIPTVVNACFIYSALSCANTALFVASRQLYGLTRTITVEEDSNVVRRILAWMSTINHKTKTPWPAIAMSALFFCWLPFIRIRDTESEYLQDVQDALINVGSVSCLLTWCSQCVAYLFYHHWCTKHAANIQRPGNWSKLLEPGNGGWLKDFQPAWGYIGVVSTLCIVFFFNEICLWNGDRLTVKATSAFVSPAVVFAIWLLKKLSRRDRGRFSLFRRLTTFEDFEKVLRGLDELIQSPSTTKQFGGIRLDAMGRETTRIDEASTSRSDSHTPRNSGIPEYNPDMQPVSSNDARNSFVNSPATPGGHLELEARTRHGDSSSTTQGQQQHRQEEWLSVRSGQVSDPYSTSPTPPPNTFSPSPYSRPTPSTRGFLSPSSAASMTRASSRPHDDISELGEGDRRA